MMRAMVSTEAIAYSPTLVSPESMSASAPSSTAFATSLASARVGLRVVDHRVQHLRGHDHRLAVLARGPHARASAAAAPARAGSPRPGRRAPPSRPSNARMIGPSRSTASGFSILRDDGQPRARARPSPRARRPRPRRARTNDSADHVHAQRQARSAGPRGPSRSCDGALTCTPGRLMPLWSETRPPSSDGGAHAHAVDCPSTRSATRPSSISTVRARPCTSLRRARRTVVRASSRGALHWARS